MRMSERARELLRKRTVTCWGAEEVDKMMQTLDVPLQQHQYDAVALWLSRVAGYIWVEADEKYCGKWIPEMQYRCMVLGGVVLEHLRRRRFLDAWRAMILLGLDHPGARGHQFYCWQEWVLFWTGEYVEEEQEPQWWGLEPGYNPPEFEFECDLMDWVLYGINQVGIVEIPFGGVKLKEPVEEVAKRRIVQWGVPFDPVLDIILGETIEMDAFDVVSGESYRVCVRFLFEAGLAIEDLIRVVLPKSEREAGEEVAKRSLSELLAESQQCLEHPKGWRMYQWYWECRSHFIPWRLPRQPVVTPMEIVKV